MILYQMTATFGKLEHQTLTLKPGLNIITAPNEWGKSTWCAFLLAMLYGIDTRSKTTKNALADKDRYAPWSGVPMEGRIDLNWQGRDITIERKTVRRIPLGEFSAYETKTGIPVPQLTAANCGQQLLGVEQSVFRRAGFIRHNDLPVTQDEALRRRLNDLVTTGDESGAADHLAQTLKELRNKCRYNRTGLLPQAETERDALGEKLKELEILEDQCRTHKLRIEDLKEWIRQLQNHQQAMAYTSYEASAHRAVQAKYQLQEAQARLQQLEQECQLLPGQDEALRCIAAIRKLKEETAFLQMKREQLPPEPEAPEIPEMFAHMTVEEARNMLRQDAADYVSARRTGMTALLIVIGFFGLLCSGVLVFLHAFPFAAVAGIGSLAALLWGILERRSMKRRAGALKKKYGTADHTRWSLPLTEYEKAQKQYKVSADAYFQARDAIRAQQDVLQRRQLQLCGSREPESALEYLAQALQTQELWQNTRREVQRAQDHYEALNAMAKPTAKPAFPDTMTQTEEQTQHLLTECTGELHRLQNRLGQYQGRMEALGRRTELQNQLQQKNLRVQRLESTYTSLTIAMNTLEKAREELQRRFAPKITDRAQELMAAMTNGRYNRVSMDTELTLRAGAAQEDTLRDIFWRSDGTMDQLYLAVRLAVAEELTPGTPLILDDALVRFDDRRMAAAIAVLRQIASGRQIILFTCQGREEAI